jgi:hypothetical protein
MLTTTATGSHDPAGAVADATGSPRTLTGEDIAQFIRHGHVTVRQAIPADDAKRMLDDTWAVFARRGIVRDDRATWPETYAIPHELSYHATFHRIAAPRLRGALDDLVGAGAWEFPRKRWGHIHVTFPERTSQPWEFNPLGWHWDYAPTSPHAGVFVIIHIGETVPGGGGTFLASGSPRVFAHLQARRRQRPGRTVHVRDLVDDHPWLKRLKAGGNDRQAMRDEFFQRATIDGDGHALRVVEATGMPGDVTLCHPTIYHATNPNRAQVPRIMRFCMATLKREKPAPDTPMAASLRPLA